MRSNCLASAFRKWWSEGGEFIMQPSKQGPFAHFKHTSISGHTTEFDPDLKVRRKVPPLVFTGEWTGDFTPAPKHSFSDLAAKSKLSKFIWLLWFPFLVAYLASVFLYVGTTQQLKELWD